MKKLVEKEAKQVRKKNLVRDSESTKARDIMCALTHVYSNSVLGEMCEASWRVGVDI